MPCLTTDKHYRDRPNALAYYCAGVVLLGIVLLGWGLAHTLSGWLARPLG